MHRIRFGIFDHIEHLPGVPLTRLYAERLTQLEALDEAGFFSYHLAEHHTPAVHSMAPSQNVFLSSAAQRTKRLRFGPGVYVRGADAAAPAAAPDAAVLVHAQSRDRGHRWHELHRGRLARHAGGQCGAL